MHDVLAYVTCQRIIDHTIIKVSDEHLPEMTRPIIWACMNSSNVQLSIQLFKKDKNKMLHGTVRYDFVDIDEHQTNDKQIIEGQSPKDNQVCFLLDLNQAQMRLNHHCTVTTRKQVCPILCVIISRPTIQMKKNKNKQKNIYRLCSDKLPIYEIRFF